MLGDELQERGGPMGVFYDAKQKRHWRRSSSMITSGSKPCFREAEGIEGRLEPDTTVVDDACHFTVPLGKSRRRVV